MYDNPFGGTNLLCMHPYVRLQDPIAGAGKYAVDCRDDGGRCGPSADLYRHKDLEPPDSRETYLVHWLKPY